MKLLIFLMLLSSSVLIAQEDINEIRAVLTPIAPVITTSTFIQASDSISESSKEFTFDFSDSRKDRKFKHYTVHPPQQALTLAEFREMQTNKSSVNSDKYKGNN